MKSIHPKALTTFALAGLGLMALLAIVYMSVGPGFFQIQNSTDTAGSSESLSNPASSSEAIWGDAGSLSVLSGEVVVQKRGQGGLSSGEGLKVQRTSIPLRFDFLYEASDAEVSFSLNQGAQFRMSGAFSVFISKQNPSEPQSAPLIVVNQGRPEVMFLGSMKEAAVFSIKGQRISIAELQENQAQKVFRLRMANRASTENSTTALENSTDEKSNSEAVATSSASEPNSFAGDLDIYRSLEAQASKFERCYKVLIQKDPNFRGVATLNFLLGSNGEAKELSVRETFLDEGFRRCLEDVVRRTRMPRLPNREPVQVVFPISFE